MEEYKLFIPLLLMFAFFFISALVAEYKWYRLNKAKSTPIKEQNGVTRDLQDRITHIDGKSIYCYSAEELSKFREDGKFTRKNND